MFSLRDSKFYEWFRTRVLAAAAAEFYKAAVGLFLLGSFVLLLYGTVSAQSRWKVLECPPPAPAEVFPGEELGCVGNVTGEELNVSHIMFGIGGSAATWERRRHYSELWWKGDRMRGFVWLDERPPGNSPSSPDKSPELRVSADARRFKGRTKDRSEVRMARIAVESVRMGLENVRWFVMGDDDTVFFVDNLVRVLSKYDDREMYYIGGFSESVEQDVKHSYGMAFGGGGFAVSYALAVELAKVMDNGCLDRYASYYGSDQRVHACLTELGVPLTPEPGFHQVDLRGSIYGLLAAHPMSPLVSLHHLDYVNPLVPGLTQHESLRSLLSASHSDPFRLLQLSFSYHPLLNWSISLSWGYTLQIYPYLLNPTLLTIPLSTFKTWSSYHDGPFTFNTRPWSSDICHQPLTYFFDHVGDTGYGMTKSVYIRRRWNESDKECEKPEFRQALKVKKVTVFAPKLKPSYWKKAPRRQCCDVGGDVRKGIHITIRRCQLGESTSPP